MVENRNRLEDMPQGEVKGRRVDKVAPNKDGDDVIEDNLHTTIEAGVITMENAYLWIKQPRHCKSELRCKIQCDTGREKKDNNWWSHPNEATRELDGDGR